MDAPNPIKKEKPKNEKTIFSFNYEFNNINYSIIILKSDENNFKFIVRNMNDKGNCYEKELNLFDLQKINKYFKMFDNSNELENDLFELCKNKNIQIINQEEEIITLCIDVHTVKNNKIMLYLNKIELDDKEKIKVLTLEITQIKNELKNKDIKISILEKKIENLENKNVEFEKKLEQINSRLENSNNLSNIILNANKKIINDSNIFNDLEELNFILKEISNDPNISLKLIFNSKIDGDDINKLESSYLNKKNLLFVIKTKKNKRFGGFSSEIFESKKFKKHDFKAFLFNINNKEIYKVRNDGKQDNDYEDTIWKDSNNDRSIRFGCGTDLRILDNFLSGDINYTRQTTSFKYNGKIYALNGEINFAISNLEIFQIQF